jgi:tRNA pseudouridine13 synthase
VPSDEHEECQGRLDRDEIVITGPMWGPKMIAPERDGEAFERQVAADMGVDLEVFDRHARLTPGTRRPLLIAPGEIDVEIDTRDGEPALVVSFFLPSGTYATVLLREMTAIDDDRIAANRQTVHSG